jgi:hypothetical protein
VFECEVDRMSQVLFNEGREYFDTLTVPPAHAA